MSGNESSRVRVPSEPTIVQKSDLELEKKELDLMREELKKKEELIESQKSFY